MPFVQIHTHPAGGDELLRFAKRVGIHRFEDFELALGIACKESEGGGQSDPLGAARAGNRHGERVLVDARAQPHFE